MATDRQVHAWPAPGFRLTPEAGGEVFSILSGALLAYGSAAILTLAFSQVGIPVSVPIAWTIIAASAVAGIFYRRRLQPPGGRQSGVRLTTGEGWLLGAGLFFYLLLWAVAYILPDAENDGLWYHNPTLHFWALKGRIHWITADSEPFWNDLIRYSWNGYMKGVECIGFLFLRAVPVSRLLNGLNLTIVPLGCLGISALTRFLGAGRLSAILGGILFLFIPTVIGHAFNLYIDASVASFYIALFAAAAFTIRSLETGHDPLKFLPALGCAIGLSLSAKGTAVVLLPLLPVLLVVYWYRAVRSFRAGARRGVVFIVLMVLIALLVGGYWYLRNYIHTGSPLYPIGLRLADKEVFPGVAIPSQFPPPDTPLTKHWPQLFRLFYSWLDCPGEWHLAMTEVSHNSGGLGLLWLFGCVPALVWLLAVIIRRRPAGLSPGTGAAWVGILVMGVIIFFAMPPRHNHKARYVIWLYGIGLPAFALAAEKVWRAPSTARRRLGRLWVLAVLIVFLAEGLYSFSYNVKRISLARQGAREGSFHASHLLRAAREPYPPGYYLPELKGSLFRVVFDNREPVALGELDSFPEQKQIVGHLTQGAAFGVRPIYFLSRATAADPGKLSRFIRERGIRYVVWNPDIPVPPALGRLAHLWDRMPYWYYLLAVSPDAAPPDRGGGGWSP
ncbi:MAG: hypothetical protein V1789_04145 [PVC group bacterium]